MSKKGEVRIQQQITKALKQKARAVRVVAEIETRKIRSEYVVASKEVRLGANPGSIFQMQMRWTISGADIEGAWSWGEDRNWNDLVWSIELLPKLQEFGKLTWAEIESQTYGNAGKRHRSHHSMEAVAICSEAQERLLELERDYPEVLFRFRLGNLPRLWGVRQADEFNVLWHDRTHQIYPIE